VELRLKVPGKWGFSSFIREKTQSTEGIKQIVINDRYGFSCQKSTLRNMLGVPNLVFYGALGFSYLRGSSLHRHCGIVGGCFDKDKWVAEGTGHGHGRSQKRDRGTWNKQEGWAAKKRKKEQYKNQTKKKNNPKKQYSVEGGKKGSKNFEPIKRKT